MDDKSGINQTGVNESGDANNFQTDSSDALGSIRNEAIKALSPLIDEIDAPPERKFELMMTAIRVNFDSTTLQKALEAAKKIEDKTARAEALIDVINETNFQEQQQ
jgi:hypothetical protein